MECIKAGYGPIKVEKKLEELDRNWNKCPSNELEIMKTCFLEMWRTDEAQNKPDFFLELQLHLLNEMDNDAFLRYLFLDRIRSAATHSGSAVFQFYLLAQEIGHVPITEAEVNLKRISDGILKTIHSKIACSHTALEINIINKIPAKLKVHTKDFLNRYIVALMKSEGVEGARLLKEIPTLWRAYLEQELNQQVSTEIDKLANELCTYLEVTCDYLKTKQKWEQRITGNDNIDHLINLVPTKNINCAGMSVWVWIKLLSSNEIEESIKQRIKVVWNPRSWEHGKPHVFVAKLDDAKQQIEYIIDPWLKYVDTDTEGKEFGCSGFCGTVAEFKDVFNRIADGRIANKYESNFQLRDDPCAPDQVAKYNEILNKL